MRKTLITLVLMATAALAQVSLDSDITANTTLTANNEYLLTKQVFVKAPAVLTIEPGVTIKALEDDGNGLAPAIIIERGAKIMAEGTVNAPITFTSNKTAEELAESPRGNWGGLIILGNAPISTTGGENYVEGVVGVPYGGNDPEDNSGILRYVRVWYGGRSIGENNEINGITLAGVGRGTTVEYVEVAYNLDDGIEWFGGTVDVKYAAILFCGDDAFDTDEGYQGRGQFLFALVGDEEGNRAYEMDNKTNGDMNSQPRTFVQFHNATLVGSGDPDALADNDQVIRLREGLSGHFMNTIIVAGKEYGVNITDDATLALIGDSLQFSSNNIIYGCPDGQFKADYGFTALDVDPQIMSLDGRESGGLIDPRPALGGPAYENVDELPNDGFFEQVNFKGAFDQINWMQGWSILYEMGRMPGLTDAKDIAKTPAEFKLLGNYPNPFNPSTNLRFELPISSPVSLSVYAMNGSLVYSQSFPMMNAGYNKVRFDATIQNLSSGIYFYQINAANKSFTGKMNLLK
ncbi:MAG TPA: T9SS type A sorting domain-containing protein [Candidatus Marinimicrobia bacterium]|nr:T9SS type A sorting domain-containing protein [Candidatus Neomarinimicrobiota bacterium]